MTGRAIPGEMAARLLGELEYEVDLVRLAKARSSEAWTEIFHQNHPKLFRYVLARVGDRETAEDLTATVFMEALKSIDSYASRGRPLLAWLYRIARNVVNYHYRSLYRKGRGQALLGPPTRSLPWTSGQGPQHDVLAAEAADRSADPASLAEMWDLREAIRGLSVDQREVIILRFLVGLSTPEAAAVVGKHERAVYSLQTRAIKALRRQLI